MDPIVGSIISSLVIPVVQGAIRLAEKAAESLGVEKAALRAAISVELRSQAEVIIHEALENEAVIDAAEAADRARAAHISDRK